MRDIEHLLNGSLPTPRIDSTRRAQILGALGAASAANNRKADAAALATVACVSAAFTAAVELATEIASGTATHTASDAALATLTAEVAKLQAIRDGL